MAELSTPPLDPRSVEDVIAQTEALATAYTVGVANGPWRPSTDGTLDFGGALIRLFGRMVEHLVGRLNQVPDKHRLAFTDLIGAKRIPAHPARAPLTFVLAAGEDTGVVPEGAQLAAVGPDGPVVFETELALPLTRAELGAVFVRDVAGAGGYADCTSIATGAAAGSFPALASKHPIEHLVYVAVEGLLAIPGASTLKLTLDGKGIPLPAAPIAWEAYGPTGWAALPAVALLGNTWVLSASASACLAVAVHGVTARWLRGTLTAAPPPVAFSASVAFSVANKIQVDPSATANLPVPLDAAYCNGQALDFKRDVLPFGERPRFNDTFYFASDPAFANAGTQVTLTIAVTKPPQGVNGSADLLLRWEAWDGQTATLLGTSSKVSAATGVITDTTNAFTADNGGTVSFTLNSAIPRSTIGSVTSRWVRVRIVAGNYGTDLQATTSGSTVTITQASFRPPSISSVALAWSGNATQAPTAIVRRTALAYEDITSAAQPVAIYRATPELVYQGTPETRSSLQLGFDRAFEPTLTTLYFQVLPPVSPAPAAFGADPPARNPPRLVWEYWNGVAWATVPVEDDTLGLARSGLVRFLPAPDAAVLAQFGYVGYWLRARSLGIDFSPVPQLGRVLVNTAWAANAHTTTLEVLGASNGARSQVFTLARVPVLAGQQIEVGEPDMPPASELAALAASEGDNAVSVDPATGLVWVRWHEVPDFWGSGPRDRHYTFDSAKGQLTFGDGSAGMIPPTGAQNVRAATYRAGGGPSGNVQAGAISQLKTTVSVVDHVTNYEPAVGGAAIGTQASMLARASRLLRHGGRAVTAQDFADLALEASLSVARSATLSPSFSPISQANGPLTGPNDLHRDGEVIVVIVPAAPEPGKAPSVDLLAEVEGYLRARCAPDAKVTVIGPSWVAATIEIHVAAVSIERSDAALSAVRAAVTRLLDPLIGGDGSGWDFGRRPRSSDLVAAVSGIADVDHLSAVSVTCEAPFDIDDTQHEVSIDELSLYDRLLVYAKSITVSASHPKVLL